ncbi:tryptophan synthase subunit alpha [Sulfuriroseicoccus oceanibius]|uniref:Tryptophan synthase alpha chain n=1 Tax=Sulfuriroseicoccus oceanibius TaxID=2707525 RepID=A0A6B3L754_9BACT|nr:tryptophan synthase subunit alpha [Sulfuriroseicoccus oceanibius]QQL43885.1 tryptophan synthase subunit alpha [Sulfuriroseicoccus oceanibius]
MPSAPDSITSSRLRDTFTKLSDANEAAFVAYLAAGHPNAEKTVEIVLALEEAGADVIELGIPFSDPLADGVVNQIAAEKALAAGTTTRGVLDMIRAIREKSEIPLVLFTYLNPVYTYGFEDFHRDAAAAGADGILCLDLPPDEAAKNVELAQSKGLSPIRLIAPTTPEERFEEVCATADGFIYYVSREGVTGVQESLAEGLDEQVAVLKKHTDVPVCVGFGISKPEQAAQVAKSADGVVVGSAIVRTVIDNADADNLAQIVHDFAKPLIDAAKSARA